ncbi:histidine decarboxylase-like [Homalodisca vitripennis]|uniref:histidine decarboxylase-like n=1 Tax=Homalodisca vitripennis TaxID=197043 RepID=UPI001EEB3144|nr:histidine decarboxylase-like [Homalodisca vitripennis]
MVDYIADYLENIRDRRVYPSVTPGYIRNLVPMDAPLEPESWDAIFGDIERVIMPGVTHWQSPHMHAYFPALNSMPSLLGDMLADAINCLGFTWASSPVCTELETVVMNWLGKMTGLPEDFLHVRSDSKGGGVIQTTASEATFISILAGRTMAIQRFRESQIGLEDAEINSRLVAYCSDQAHSSVEKAGLIGLVKMRYIESDDNLSLRGDKLEEAIKKDREKGLVPFFLCATLGSTGACSFDNLEELGPICDREGLWLHVDAAYAGSAFICPEFRKWLSGISYADSFAFNPSKWLMVHFDCTAMWVKNSEALHRTFNVEPIYLQHENSGLAIDYMHWQVGLSKRFRALKLWFVIRRYGITGLQSHIREGVRLAQNFEALVLADPRFEVPAPRHLGLVVIRLRGENLLTERLLKRLNSRGNIHCVPALLKGKYVIRFTVTSSQTTLDDIMRDWMEIRSTANEVIAESTDLAPPSVISWHKVPLGETRERNADFGSSLLLANSPMSPKIVNGSYAAIFEFGGPSLPLSHLLSVQAKDSPAMRRRIRGILMSGKQFSLDSRMDLVQGFNPGQGPSDLPGTVEEDSEPEPKMVLESDDGEENTPRPNRSRSVDHSNGVYSENNGFADNPVPAPTVDTAICRKCGHYNATKSSELMFETMFRNIKHVRMQFACHERQLVCFNYHCSEGWLGVGSSPPRRRCRRPWSGLVVQEELATYGRRAISAGPAAAVRRGQRVVPG